MARRTKEGQKVHDQKVAGTASRLTRAGYTVRADLPGRAKPPTLGGYIPDIYATKRGKTLIREVETSGTIGADKAQHEAFRRAAARKGAGFRVLKAQRKQ